MTHSPCEGVDLEDLMKMHRGRDDRNPTRITPHSKNDTHTHTQNMKLSCISSNVQHSATLTGIQMKEHTDMIHLQMETNLKIHIVLQDFP